MSEHWTVSMTIRVPPEVLEQLEREAEIMGRTRSSLAAELLGDALSSHAKTGDVVGAAGVHQLLDMVAALYPDPDRREAMRRAIARTADDRRLRRQPQLPGMEADA